MRLRLLTGQVTHVLKGQVTRLLLLVDDLDEAEREAERAFEHGDPTAERVLDRMKRFDVEGNPADEPVG